MHKAAALAGPLAMMYETNATQGMEWPPTSSEEESEPECEPIPIDDVKAQGIHLSLCDGIGCAAYAYTDVMTGATFTDYVAFETSDDAKRISYSNFPWINFDWGSDVMDIT